MPTWWDTASAGAIPATRAWSSSACCRPRCAGCRRPALARGERRRSHPGHARRRAAPRAHRPAHPRLRLRRAGWAAPGASGAAQRRQARQRITPDRSRLRELRISALRTPENRGAPTSRSARPHRRPSLAGTGLRHPGCRLAFALQRRHRGQCGPRCARKTGLQMKNAVATIARTRRARGSRAGSTAVVLGLSSFLPLSARDATAASPCAAATHPEQGGWFDGGTLPPFAHDAIVAKGGALGSGNVLVATVHRSAPCPTRTPRTTLVLAA